jgi:hypothetical protein
VSDLSIYAIAGILISKTSVFSELQTWRNTKNKRKMKKVEMISVVFINASACQIHSK